MSSVRGFITAIRRIASEDGWFGAVVVAVVYPVAKWNETRPEVLDE